MFTCLIYNPVFDLILSPIAIFLSSKFYGKYLYYKISFYFIHGTFPWSSTLVMIKGGELPEKNKEN